MSFPELHRPIRHCTRSATQGLPLAILFLCLGSTQAHPQSASTEITVSGVVLNVNTNQPIARALVQINSEALLTGHDGRFEFSGPSGSSATLHVAKPGFYDGLDPNPRNRRIVFASSSTIPLKVYLFPEGLLTGTITAPNSDPLPGIRVQALRKSHDQLDNPWTIAGQTSTNADGQFRFPLSAGDYVLETRYQSERPVTKQAVLPLIVPDPGTSGSSVIHLESGSEQRLDLRPQLRATREVHIQIDGLPSHGLPALEARLPNGLTFSAVSRGSSNPGEYVTTLPTGQYTLTMTSLDGGETIYGEAAVTVADKDVSGVVLHLSRTLPLPVELSVDPSSTSDNQTPVIQQFNLLFVREEQSPSTNNQFVSLQSGRGEAPAFHLLPGRYKLKARAGGDWFVKSATVGATDLLTQDFDVESGGAALPLRIVVSNLTASLEGNVKLDGAPSDDCSVYLLATSPSIVPVYIATSGADGSFTKPYLPPGGYRAIAFEARQPVDLSDAATLERLTSYIRSITVAAGELATVSLDAVPTSELKP